MDSTRLKYATGKLCIAAGCSNTNNDGYSMHAFPKRNDPVCRIWINFVKTKRAHWKGPSIHSHLCSAHFTTDCFPFRTRFEMNVMGVKPPRMTLVKGSYPTIHSPSKGPSANVPSGSTSPRCTPSPVKKRKAFLKREVARIITENESVTAPVGDVTNSPPAFGNKRVTLPVKDVTTSQPTSNLGSKDTNDAMILYKCVVCDTIFQQFNDLAQHSKIHVKDEKTDDVDEYCHVKEEKTDDVDGYCHVKEEKTDDIETVHQCNLCVEEFKCYTDLEKHCEIHVKEEEHVLQCGNNWEASFSEYNETGCGTSYKCDVCSKSFIMKHNLQAHMRIHTGEKQFKCDVCSKSFSLKGHLISHAVIHSREKSFKCDVCSKSFTRRFDRQRHMRIHTGEILYKCDVCGKSFLKDGNFQTHMRIHTGGKTFIHSGKKAYKCDVCDKSFFKNGNLQAHKRIHTREEPYKCDVCSKSFSQKGHLVSHAVIHLGEKAYKCGVCAKLFTRNTNLQSHMRIHTGETPYKCDVCGESFISRYRLKTHALLHTGGKPYW